MRTDVASPDPEPRQPNTGGPVNGTNTFASVGDAVCDWQPRPRDPVRAAQIRAYALAWYATGTDAAETS